MKKLSIASFLILLVLTGFAQQRPHYTQYILNNYILNPALTGIENYTDLKISARDQWVGLSGAPRTAYLSVHTAIGKKDLKTSITSYSIPGENPRGNAYHLSLSPKTNLAAGFAGGIIKVGYDRSKANPADPNDPAIGNSNNIYKI